MQTHDVTHLQQLLQPNPSRPPMHHQPHPHRCGNPSSLCSNPPVPNATKRLPVNSKAPIRVRRPLSRLYRRAMRPHLVTQLQQQPNRQLCHRIRPIRRHIRHHHAPLPRRPHIHNVVPRRQYPDVPQSPRLGRFHPPQRRLIRQQGVRPPARSNSSSGGVRSYTVTSPSASSAAQLKSPGFKE